MQNRKHIGRVDVDIRGLYSFSSRANDVRPEFGHAAGSFQETGEVVGTSKKTSGRDSQY